MPINENLEPVELPMNIRFGEEPKTKFKNNLSSIDIELIEGPDMNDLRRYLVPFLEATWDENPTVESYYNMDLREKDKIIRDLFEGKALPTAMETINLVFLIKGISLQEVTHILRYRNASFSADCSGDKWWSNKNSLVPNSIQNSDEFFKRYKEITKAAKKLYADMINSKNISIMDARYILPRNLETYYYMKIDIKTAIHFIKQRIDRQIQPETDNVMAYQMYSQLLIKYPILHGIIDIDTPSKFYQKMARTGKATNLYFPEPINDNFDYNPNDFIYQKYRWELCGTNENSKSFFRQKLLPYYRRSIKDLNQISKSELEENYKNNGEK